MNQAICFQIIELNSVFVIKIIVLIEKAPFT